MSIKNEIVIDRDNLLKASISYKPVRISLFMIAKNSSRCLINRKNTIHVEKYIPTK